MQLPHDVLTLNSWLCSHLNRETHSTVCGRCTNGTGPSVCSVGSECAPCSPVNVLYYILLHYTPATIIFLLILLVQMDVITSAPILYYILYANARVVYLETPDGFSTYVAFTGQHYKYTMRAVFILHSLWSFDSLYIVSPSLCISSHLDDTDVQYIKILKTLYPFVLLFLAYVGIQLYARDFKPVVLLWKPIHNKIVRLNKSWNPHLSLVQAFSTIFFISYFRLVSLIFKPMIMTYFIDDHGQYVQNSRVTHIDPAVPIGHYKHLCLTVISIIILVFMILSPILVLITYPTRLFRKFQDYLPPRVNIALKMFVSTFQGGYKDGADGTRDYRSLSGLILAAFLVVMAIQYGVNTVPTLNKTPLIIWQINIILFVLVTSIFAVLRPHKSKFANNIGVCLGALLTIGSTLHVIVLTYFKKNMMVIFLGIAVQTIPHFVFCGYVIHRIVLKCGFKRALRKCCREVQSREMEEQPMLNNTF